jgi:hypothetical protein
MDGGQSYFWAQLGWHALCSVSDCRSAFGRWSPLDVSKAHLTAISVGIFF